MDSLTQLQEDSRVRVLKHRQMDRLVNTPQFKVLWEATTTTDEERYYIELSILLGKLDNIKKLLEPNELSAMNTQSLIKLAARARIFNYSRLSKVELILELEKINES